MSKKPAHPMPIEERAKQFLPFAALSGLNEALAAKEAEVERLSSSGLQETPSELSCNSHELS